MKKFSILLGVLTSVFAHGRTNTYPCDKFVYGQQAGKDLELEIYSITHGSVVLRTEDAEIFIDPVMNMDGRKFQYGEFEPRKVSAVLISHEHYDHLDKKAINYLSNRESLQIFGNRKAIESLGKGEVLDNGGSTSIANNTIKIKAVPAYNTTDGHLKFHPKGNGNGYLIEIGELVIYVAGDTEVIPEMKELGKVDIALLPVNQPYTMTPQQCIAATKDINPRVLIPYHMGNTDMTPVIKEFEGSGIKVIFHEELR